MKFAPEHIYSILFQPEPLHSPGDGYLSGYTSTEAGVDIIVGYDGKILKDRYGNAAEVLKQLTVKSFDDAVNTRVGECMAIINADHEDKIKELELLAESSVRRRDLAEKCEDSMSRICAQQVNEIRRLEGDL